MKKWTKEEVELLKSEYWQGKPEELCVLFNRDWESIRAKAFRENIKRDKSFAFRYSKGKSTIDEKFFKNWSHEMAYILGFITADGCIFENRLMFTLHLQDVDILYKIANCLGENIICKRLNNGKICILAKY